MAAVRAAETEEQRQARCEEDRTRNAVSRAAETAEQTSSRLAGQRTRQAASRTVETPEELRARRDQDRAWHAASRAAESPEALQTRRGTDRSRHAVSRAAESPEVLQGRRGADRSRQAVSRAAETSEQRRTRSEDQRTRQATSRAALWTFMEGEAFKYDPTKSYDSHPQLFIGRMTNVCSHCEALKWPAEAPGTAVVGYPNVRETDALGRVYTVHPNNFECFFLRLLLHTVRGPTSFETLRTVNGRICATFREACQLHGLLEDDQQWDATMSEAAAAQSPARLRNLFALILTTCGPSNPKQLWESYKESLTEDILREARRQNPGMNLDYTPDMFNQVLLILEDKTLQMAGKTLDDLHLPTPQRNLGDRLSSEMLRETSYDVKELDAYVAANEPLLVPDQRTAYNAILGQIKEKAAGIIFLDAPGGTGKTFVINLLLAKIRKESKIAIAVASSAIAATLLQGGRTAHSTLKLPFKFMHDEHHLCSIRKGTGEAKILEVCELIVWDECTMAHRYALEALNNTLQDLRGNGKNMGGVVVLLAGNFRQTLPVIQKGTMADELKACLKSSYLWRHVKSLTPVPT
ncbi:unnamed protein product [Rotaria sp. Silwood1]|nr:unnamed protein product [Rotaria sp. Silwood1]